MHGDHKDKDFPMNGMNEYESTPSAHSNPVFIGTDRSSKKGKGKGKAKEEHVFQLTDDIHAAESMVPGKQNAAHKYEVRHCFVVIVYDNAHCLIGYLGTIVFHNGEVRSVRELSEEYSQGRRRHYRRFHPILVQVGPRGTYVGLQSPIDPG